MMINLSCPGCNTRNRVPEKRLGDNPKCGRCKEALFQGKSLTLSQSNLNAVLGNDIPVLVDCWASWCGPCQQFSPIFEASAAEHEPKLRFAKLNTEQEQLLAGQWQIRSIPTLILFKAGKEVARLNGALPKAQLDTWLKQQGVL